MTQQKPPLKKVLEVRGRTSNLRTRASTWENAHFTRGHAAYRQHLENLRALLVGIEFTVARDADEAGRWLRRHGAKSKVCPRMGWWYGLMAGIRYRYKGKLVAELVLEAARDAVLMAEVHIEYMAMEDGPVPSDRYRTEES